MDDRRFFVAKNIKESRSDLATVMDDVRGCLDEAARRSEVVQPLQRRSRGFLGRFSPLTAGHLVGYGRTFRNDAL